MLNKREEADSFDKEGWLEVIMEEYGEKLTKLCYNYLKDWNLAQDVVQDVFVICYKNYENVERIASFKSWVYRITINKCKDVLKSSSYRKVIINTKIFSLFKSREASPETVVVNDYEKERLSLAVLKLPIKYREVIVLYYYEELTIEQISELLKVNRNTVKTRIQRGRMKLKILLEGWQ